jgi:hypothetical protein
MFKCNFCTKEFDSFNGLTKHAADRNYQLHRFWENDIVNNRFEVVGKLMEILKH